MCLFTHIVCKLTVDIKKTILKFRSVVEINQTHMRTNAHIHNHTKITKKYNANETHTNMHTNKK